MAIKHRIIILTAFALSSAGCTEEPRQQKPQRDEPTELTAKPVPVLASTVTPTKPEPAPVELPPPVAVAEDAEEPDVPEPAAEPRVETIDGVTIERLVTASEIDGREPVDPRAAFFTSDEKVYAFVEVSNESESAKLLLVHFIGPEGRVSGGVELEIPAAVPRWRTWAFTRHFDTPGPWRVEIRDPEGGILGALPFEVEAER